MPDTSPSIPYICNVSSRSTACWRTRSSIESPNPSLGSSSRSSEGKIYPSKSSGRWMSDSFAALPPVATRTGNFAIFFTSSAGDNFLRGSSSYSSSSYSSSSYSSSGYSSSSHSSSTSSSCSRTAARFNRRNESDGVDNFGARMSMTRCNPFQIRCGIANATFSAPTTSPIENAAKTTRKAPNPLKFASSCVTIVFAMSPAFAPASVPSSGKNNS